MKLFKNVKAALTLRNKRSSVLGTQLYGGKAQDQPSRSILGARVYRS